MLGVDNFFSRKKFFSWEKGRKKFSTNIFFFQVFKVFANFQNQEENKRFHHFFSTKSIFPQKDIF